MKALCELSPEQPEDREWLLVVESLHREEREPSLIADALHHRSMQELWEHFRGQALQRQTKSPSDDTDDPSDQ